LDGIIGGTTPAAGAFTTLSASGLITATGGQIAFPATAVPSADPNTLDDYEEGTWTFDLQFGGAKVDITYNASFTLGSYVKIGKQVTCTGLMILTSKGTSNGDAVLYKLPFSVGGAYQNTASVSLALNLVSFANQFQGNIDSNAWGIAITEITEAGVQTNLTDANFTNNSCIRVSATYFI